MVIDGLQSEYVNGFDYNQVLPAPDAEIPERFGRAEEVYKRKLWREQLREWDETRSRRPSRSIGSCKPSTLTRYPTRSWSHTSRDVAITMPR